MRFFIIPLIVCGSVPAWAAPRDAVLDQAVSMGGVAAVAPICGLRDQGWATDLRRAEMLAVQGTSKQAGRDVGTGSLSYADDEALEDLAEQSPERGCAALARSPRLKQADRVVQEFRATDGRGPIW